MKTHCANCGVEIDVDKPHQVGECPPPLTLTDFLLARIAEDESTARCAVSAQWTAVGTHYPDESVDPEEMIEGYVDTFPDGPVVIEQEIHGGTANHIARHDPARVLAECEAKRRIVDRCMAAMTTPRPDGRWAVDGTLRDLASVYADHPDFREEWRA